MYYSLEPGMPRFIPMLHMSVGYTPVVCLQKKTHIAKTGVFFYAQCSFLIRFSLMVGKRMAWTPWEGG